MRSSKKKPFPNVMGTLFRPGPGMKGCGISALLFFSHLPSMGAEVALPHPAQTEIGPIPAVKAKADTAGVTYVGGQLTIHVLNATLSAVLDRVASLTGMQIDFTEGVNNQVMPIVQLGPGPARQVLASLLSDSNSDFLIQGSDKDPEKLQLVVVLPRNKQAGEASPAGSNQNLYEGVSKGGELNKREAQNSPLPAQAENVVAEAKTADPQITPMQAEQSPESTAGQRERSSLTTTPPLAPPTDMAPESINRQLQQMYQQRMQITQQERQQVQPASKP